MSVATLSGGRYRIERLLGSGGMAVVYCAHDEELSRTVAVKLPAEHLAEDEEFRARFLREARVAARLSHPNVVAVYDAGEDEGRPFIVMEVVEGETLAAVLARRGRLRPDEVVDLGGQAAAGLEHAHSHGLVHRDVKPHNLLLRDDGVLKVADFGIARAATATQRLTRVGTILGTAAYLAPEQARGEEAGPAADLYALGVVTYQLISGRLPYEATSLTELAFKQQNESPTPLHELVPEVPSALSAAVAVALAMEPAQRYASAPEMAEALGDGLRGVFPERAEATAATSLLARDDETGATRMMGPDSPRAEPAVRPRQPRRPRPPVEPVDPPAVRDRDAAGAERRRAREQGGRDRSRRRSRRWIALLLVLLLLGGGVAAAIVLADQSNAVKHVPVDGRDVNSIVDQLHQLVDENTR
jgi:eukaryotic-like serine/threonine-protein kinase